MIGTFATRPRDTGWLSKAGGPLKRSSTIYFSKRHYSINVANLPKNSIKNTICCEGYGKVMYNTESCVQVCVRKKFTTLAIIKFVKVRNKSLNKYTEN
jgi:hypothetical protein